MTPLHSAVDTGTIECVKVLLEHRGIDVNVQNEKGLIALHIAVENGLTESVRELLSDKRINVDIATNKGETPLNLQNIPRPYTNKKYFLFSNCTVKSNRTRSLSIPRHILLLFFHQNITLLFFLFFF